MLSRRTFVSWLSGLGAAFGVGIRPRSAVGATSADRNASTQTAALDVAMVTRVAEVVLPGELGESGFARAARDFTQWIGGYRPGVELVHPYGSANLRNTGPSPTGRWQSQLAALDRASRETHQRAFTALPIAQRRDLVNAALAADRTTRMPDPLEANHVALALMAWYFASPDATDRCYQSRIGRNQCRPLVNAPRQPLPLAGNGRPGLGSGHERLTSPSA
jgi:hypothetical protein